MDEKNEVLADVACFVTTKESNLTKIHYKRILFEYIDYCFENDVSWKDCDNLVSYLIEKKGKNNSVFSRFRVIRCYLIYKRCFVEKEFFKTIRYQEVNCSNDAKDLMQFIVSLKPKGDKSTRLKNEIDIRDYLIVLLIVFGRKSYSQIAKLNYSFKFDNDKLNCILDSYKQTSYFRQSMNHHLIINQRGTILSDQSIRKILNKRSKHRFNWAEINRIMKNEDIIIIDSDVL